MYSPRPNLMPANISGYTVYAFTERVPNWWKLQELGMENKEAATELTAKILEAYYRQMSFGMP